MTIQTIGYAVGYLIGVAMVSAIPVICLGIVLVVTARILKKIQVAEIVIPAPSVRRTARVPSGGKKDAPSVRNGKRETVRKPKDQPRNGYERWALWKSKDGRRVFLARKNGTIVAEIHKITLPEELKKQAVSANGKTIVQLPADPAAAEWKTLAGLLKMKRNWTLRAGTQTRIRKAFVPEVAEWLAR